MKFGQLACQRFSRQFRLTGFLSSLFLAFFFLQFLGVALAMPASPLPQTLSQPDGSSFEAITKGDERLNWIETADGHTIAKGPDSYWRYVLDFDGDQPVLSEIQANQQPDPAIEKGLKPGISASSMISIDTLSSSDPASLFESGSASIGGSFSGKLLIILGYYDNRLPNEGLNNQAFTQSHYAGLAASLNTYYDTVSHGMASLAPATESFGANNGVIGWLRLGAAHPNPGGSYTLKQQIAKAAIEAANPYINYAGYDANGDGYVDGRELSILVVVAGYEQAYSGSSTPSVWAHAGSISGSVGVPYVDGKYVGTYRNGGHGYTEIGEVHADHLATVGAPAHELGHLTFLLPDLYDTDGSTLGLASWCLMSNGAWGSKTSDSYLGETPVVPSAWVRQKLGWALPMAIRDIFPVTAAGSSRASVLNSVYKASTGLSTQYFLLENRQLMGYDRGLEAWLTFGLAGGDLPIYAISGGIVIYHVDETCPGNANEKCRLVDLEPADNEESISYQLFDPWRPGTQVRFYGSSSPSSKLNNGSPSGVDITVLSPSGEDMIVSRTPAI